MRHNWKIIVDGDDSIWDCNIYFRRADQACAGLLSSVWPVGPSQEDILNHHRTVHRARLKKLGFSLHCYEEGWVETYRQLCWKHQRPYGQPVADLLWDIAGVPLSAPYTLFPGVLEAFDQIRAMGHTLHLLTTGDDAFQRSKSTRNGLDPYFDSVHVVQFGKESVLWSYAKRYRYAMMVGDSLKRDVLTARRVGLEAVLIANANGEARGAPSLNGHGYHIINHVAELPPILGYLPFRTSLTPRR